MQAHGATTDSLLSLSAVRTLAGGLSESSIRRLVAAGEFPAPITLSLNRRGTPARVAWVASEVQAWITDRIAAARTTRPVPA